MTNQAALPKTLATASAPNPSEFRHQMADRLIAAFRTVRDETERRAAPLSPEDQLVQSMPDASPAKWHRAHVTWFWEQFLLGAHSPGYTPSNEHPVTNVTWRDAEAFCAWLSRKEGRTCRLPTEAEWEHACRAGTSTLWSFGDDFKSAREHMWSNNANLKPSLAPHAVGKLKANAFGLCDMHGNVEEMCADYRGRRYVSEPPLDDPKGPADTKQGRIARGGSYFDIPHAGRSAYRGGEPGLPFAHLGFRVVCEIPATRPAEAPAK